ncbi:hypothetical protein ACOMCU_26445 [Lysinibacillus sp. UGB7]|uniref:hypothetical protein n=1 Tax=Lysinibacillus sp. UGB7 TaxID=3411039 RepID=UPI003B7D57F7
MKKFLFGLVALYATFAFFNVGGSSAKAASSVEKSIEEAYKDAKNGITDIPNYQLRELGNSEVDSDETMKTKQYKTAQILEENNETGDQVVVVTVFNDVVLEDETSSITPFAEFDPGASDWDSSISVQAYSRFYYTTSQTSGGTTYAKLTKVNGGWNISDSSVSLSNRIVKYGANGGSTLGSSNTTYTQNPTSNTFTYNLPSNYSAVSIDAVHFIGVTTTVTLKRGTSSVWTLKLTNNR